MSDNVGFVLLSMLGLASGGAIGLFFGSIQNAALLRNIRSVESGKLRSGWMIMPGAFGRITILLAVLVAVQVCCPILFDGNAQWLVSAGVLLGYGWALLRRSRGGQDERS